MKNLIILLLLLISVSSCSSNYTIKVTYNDNTTEIVHKHGQRPHLDKGCLTCVEYGELGSIRCNVKSFEIINKK